MGLIAGLTFDKLSVATLFWVGIALLVAYAIYYVVYHRYFHPLARFPGPFLASLTDLWQVSQFYGLKQPYTLTELHAKHGEFVRYGPDKLSVTCEDAITPLYQKGGRSFPKTEFYDAYGAAHPNVFGMRDEEAHSIRRRHMSHSFSISNVKKMEPYLDDNLAILRWKLDEQARSGAPFDLKKFLHYYTIDVLGELAVSQSFGIQETDDEALIPPVVEHSLLAACTGAWPSMTFRLKRWLPKVPYPPLQRLFQGRKACADLASTCVSRRLTSTNADTNGDRSTRTDILTSLINAKHPDTGKQLTQLDLETEAFGFIIAGRHTTSATTSLLFHHLLHTPHTLQACIDEIDKSLSPLSDGKVAFSVTDVESSLPYLRQCVRENFRITPVFTMPLARRILAPQGLVIGGESIPQHTSIAVCNHAFHHNPNVWGEDHAVFDPSRWDRPEYNSRARYLMHFGLGGRQCIGKTIAQTNIYKLSSTLLKRYKFELADSEEAAAVARGKYVGVIPEMVSVGISDLEKPLMVKVALR